MSTGTYIVLFSLLLACIYVYMEGILCHEEGSFHVILQYLGSEFLCLGVVLIFSDPYRMFLLGSYIMGFVYFIYHKENGYYSVALLLLLIVALLGIFHPTMLHIVTELVSVSITLMSMASILFLLTELLALLPFLIKLQRSSYEVPSFPIISICTLFLFCLLCGNLTATKSWLFLYTCTLFGICILIKQAMRIELRSQRILQENYSKFQSKENEERYQWLQQENQHMARMIHDMKKHVVMLDTYMKDHKDETMEKYRLEVAKQADEMLDCIRFGNPMIDRIISTYAQKLKQAQISFNVEMDDIDVSFLAPVDLCAVLMNMLDNAIESCMQAKEKFILLKLKEAAPQVFIIKMKNSCDFIKDQDGKLMTSKPDAMYHGFGLKNMEQIAQKYHGAMHTAYDEKRHIFTTTVRFTIEE